MYILCVFIYLAVQRLIVVALTVLLCFHTLFAERHVVYFFHLVLALIKLIIQTEVTSLVFFIPCLARCIVGSHRQARLCLPSQIRMAVFALISSQGECAFGICSWPTFCSDEGKATGAEILRMCYCAK